ncbi:hypothetical protein DEO72_LG7g1 [Vigna unguiculata]|uniref:Uncharacterized protein n=1 Tax=Vigna unguiculata TaxID=3917 RepID=A0A4D6MG12_VIGUN|nr:hypothetical protein DEO72_LG7g1 [Vigna unguiculata]
MMVLHPPKAPLTMQPHLLPPNRFPNSVEFGHKGLSPNHSQGKSPSRLRLDQVQRLGPPATPHDIIHSALSERE